MIFDTAPIFVVEPKPKWLGNALHQPKYGGTVYKIQIGINFLGWICCYTGPHLG
jgi:hypothetical protein